MSYHIRPWRLRPSSLTFHRNSAHSRGNYVHSSGNSVCRGINSGCRGQSGESGDEGSGRREQEDTERGERRERSLLNAVQSVLLSQILSSIGNSIFKICIVTSLSILYFLFGMDKSLVVIVYHAPGRGSEIRPTPPVFREQRKETAALLFCIPVYLSFLHLKNDSGSSPSEVSRDVTHTRRRRSEASRDVTHTAAAEDTDDGHMLCYYHSAASWPMCMLPCNVT